MLFFFFSRNVWHLLTCTLTSFCSSFLTFLCPSFPVFCNCRHFPFLAFHNVLFQVLYFLPLKWLLQVPLPCSLSDWPQSPLVCSFYQCMNIIFRHLFCKIVLGFSSPWWVLWLKCHVRHLLYVWDRFSFDSKFRFIYFFYFFECLILWSSRLLDYFIHSCFLVSKQLPKSYRLFSHKLGCGLELGPRALHVLGKGSPSYLDAIVCARDCMC